MSKKIKAIQLYRDFQCLAADCPDTCCRGWTVPVDEKTADLYRSAPEPWKGKLAHAVNEKAGRTLRMPFGKCPFETGEGLCRFQCEGHREYMPHVCRIYPRRTLEFDDCMELTLELTCPEAARLFLENLGRLDFYPLSEEECRQAECAPGWPMENSDPAYYEFLSAITEELLDYLWAPLKNGTKEGLEDWANETDLPRFVRQQWTMFFYMRRCHDDLLGGRMEEARRLKVADFEDEDPASSEENPAGAPRKASLFYPMETFDAMISRTADEQVLIDFNRNLKRHVKRYYHYFDRMSAKEADAFLQRTLTDMMETNPGLMPKYYSYLSYHLQQAIPGAFENYYLLRVYLLAIANLQVLMLLDLLDFLDGDGKISREQEIANLRCMEKRYRHNDVAPEKIMEIVRQNMDLQ